MTNQQQAVKAKSSNPYYPQPQMFQQHSANTLNNPGPYNNGMHGNENNNVMNYNNNNNMNNYPNLNQYNRPIQPLYPQGQNNNMINQQGTVQYPFQYQQQESNRPIVVIQQQQSSSPFTACPICQKNTQTFLIRKNGCLIWSMCLLFCLFLWCLFWIPFTIDSWKDIEYRCQKCGTVKYTVQGSC